MTKSLVWNLTAGFLAVLLTLGCIGRLLLSNFLSDGYRHFFATGLAAELTLLVLVLHVVFVSRLLQARRGPLALGIAAVCTLLYLLGDNFFSGPFKVGG